MSSPYALDSCGDVRLHLHCPVFWKLFCDRRRGGIVGSYDPHCHKNCRRIPQLVPGSIKEASLALGIPKWKTTLYIVLSTARRGIITGALLAIARISGETAPLLFTSFGNMFWSGGIDKPTSTLPVQIYTYAITPFPDWHAKAWAGALVLIIFILILNIAVRFVTRRKYS